MELKRCIDCYEAFEPDHTFNQRCDSCSIKRIPTSGSESGSLLNRNEKEKIYEWSAEKIKQDWAKAAEDSRALILAKYNAR